MRRLRYRFLGRNDDGDLYFWWTDDGAGPESLIYCDVDYFWGRDVDAAQCT